MAQNVTLNIPSHKNIYTGKSNRYLRVEVSLPSSGCNKETGLAVLVEGFGSNVDTKQYVEMRALFADKYNLITIQCEYFGSAHMQGVKSHRFKNPKTLHEVYSMDEIKEIVADPSLIMQTLSKKQITMDMVENIEESMDDFNDMGFMQAIDIITALEATKIYLLDKKYEFNKDRVIGYGYSHGAFLLNLCNRIAPVFSFIIDNSAWLEPIYLTTNRVIHSKLGTASLRIEFSYIARELFGNQTILNLKEIYKGFINKTHIVCFQGDEDNFVNHYEKQEMIKRISNIDLHVVTAKEVDNIKFKSNKHGLGADFLELFAYALSLEKPTKLEAPKSNYTVELDLVTIDVDYTNGLPIFNFDFKFDLHFELR